MLIVVLLYRFASAQQRSKIDLEREITERTAELRESLDYQTAISDVLKAISRSTFDLAPVLQVVLDTATRLCRAQMAGIYQFQDGTFRWMAGSGAGGPAQHDLLSATAPTAPAWDDLVVRVAGGARTVSVSNASAEGAQGDITGVRRLGTMLGLPMTRDGQLIGVLALARESVEPFSAKQIELATVFADQAAIAIENVRLINEIREKGWQLERALQHKSQFLATMSHELRTPMNGVLGMIDVLEAEGPGKDQTHTLNMMRESAQVLLRNINDLLDYSRIEAGALRLEELPFVLKDLIDGAVEVFKPQATRKGLSLVGIVASSPADAFVGDPTRVRQIIFNLLSNALKFTDRGGVMLRASAEPVDGGMARVVLAVTDTGIGISSEQQARLFKPFSPGRQLDHAPLRRQRPRPFDRQAAGRADAGRRDRQQPAGLGRDLHRDPEAEAHRGRACGARPGQAAAAASKSASAPARAHRQRPGRRRQSDQLRGDAAPAQGARHPRRFRRPTALPASAPGAAAATTSSLPTSTCR